MDKFTTLTGIAAPLPLRNIDTDMIIPKQFLKTILRTGLGKSLFYEMRFDQASGTEVPDFVLNKPTLLQMAFTSILTMLFSPVIFWMLFRIAKACDHSINPEAGRRRRRTT